MFVPQENIEYFETKNFLYSVTFVDGKVAEIGETAKGCGAVDTDYSMHYSKEGIVSIESFLDLHAAFGYGEKPLSEVSPLVRFLLTANPKKVKGKIRYYQRKEKNN